ncbi:MAG: hypothetical protein ACLPWF_15385 [Bryobacteraceae bacterium]
MKNKTCLFAFGILVAMAPLHAADVQARWNDLCRVAGAHQLNVTTSDGKTVSGTCIGTSGDDLSLTVKHLTSNQGAIKVARSTLTRIQMYDPGNGHHLADLGDGMSKSFKKGFGWLFSPAAPLGLVAIPATVAWGAVSAPFCLLGDMGSNGPTTQDIKLSD